MFSESSESPITTIVAVAFRRAAFRKTSLRNRVWLVLAVCRQRSLWTHATVECMDKSLVIGTSQSFAIDTTKYERASPVADRVHVPVDRPEEVLLDMAAAVRWLRVTHWQMFLCWLTRGRYGADCVAVTKHILQYAGVPVPHNVRRVKELREWLTHTYKA